METATNWQNPTPKAEFRVVVKNINYPAIKDTAQDTAQDTRFNMLVDFCSVPRTRDEMQTHIGIEHREYFRKAFLKPLLESGKLQMTIPDKPNSPNQKYKAV